VRKDIQLSDGSRLPKGTFISVPTYSTARDPAYYDSVEDFDPFRFARMRKESPTQTNDEHAFSSVAPSSLGFGYGAYACPGRFFAAREMKVLLGTLLMHYDFKFPGEQTERPENMYVDERIWPDRTQKVGFRPRKSN
jgi:cytochrome P450